MTIILFSVDPYEITPPIEVELLNQKNDNT